MAVIAGVIEELKSLCDVVSPNCVMALDVSEAHKVLVRLKTVLNASSRKGELLSHSEEASRLAAKIIVALSSKFGSTEAWQQDINPLVTEICKHLANCMYLSLGTNPRERETLRQVHQAIVVLVGLGIRLPTNLYYPPLNSFSRDDLKNKEYEEALTELQRDGKALLELTFRLGSGEYTEDRYQRFRMQFDLIEVLERLGSAMETPPAES